MNAAGQKTAERMSQMQIRRKTEKPMVIHTKERTRIHARGKQETRIKGRNVLTVTRHPGVTRNTAVQTAYVRQRAETLLSTKQKRNMGHRRPGSGGRAGYNYASQKKPYTGYPGSGGRSCHNYTPRKPVRKKGASTLQMAGTAGAKTVSDQMEGGDDLHDACMTADFLTKPVKGTAQSVRRARQRIKKTGQSDMASGKKHASDLQAENIKNIRQVEGSAPGMAHKADHPAVVKNMDDAQSFSVSGIHKRDAGDIFLSGAGEGTGVLFPDKTAYGAQAASEKPAWESMQGMAGKGSGRTEKKKAQKNARRTAHKAVKEIPKKTVKKASEETAKKVTKEAVKQTIKVTASAAGTAAGTAATGAGGLLTGIAAGEAAGIKLDRHDMKVSTKKRMIQLYVAKLKQDENHDSIAKAVRDIVLMRFFTAAKYVTKYTALSLALVFLMAAFLTVPVISTLAVIYNSPLAVLFPSISSAETMQEVLSGYAAEFNRDIENEMGSIDGYDRAEKVYVGYNGSGVPDNFCDILAVYMVKYGNGDTATDMTGRAKQNLKKVFDDMCSYSTSSGTETEQDENGNDVDYRVKYVDVTLKTYHDMISRYGFDAEEQAMLDELMKPEYMGSPVYQDTGGGQELDPERYQAVLDAVSDANGKRVLEFALSKVGYPYSQALRDDGEHFDCSSLAYYAWRHAGVSISYQGSTTAAYEGKLCHDNDWLVHYGDMQPGDLIFYSYERNGRFMNISHVAIYAGDGMVVEAANKRLGVVYRPIQGKSSIVMIGRPR